MISIIVCYRNREDHLKKFVPHMRKFFANQEHEIIVVEQADTEKFRRGNLLNEGVRIAKGNVVALHDVDYLPVEGTSYWAENCDVFRPAHQVEFIMMDGSLRPESDIPSGYRHFKDKVDDDFFGAVTVFDRDAFIRINGFNSLYDGWGLEDADLRERIKANNLRVVRGEGKFHALPHEDSFPGLQDQAFQYNQKVFQNWKQFVTMGYNSTFPVITERVDKRMKWGVDAWIEATDFISATPETHSYMTVQSVTDFYEDTPEKHKLIWNGFKTIVNAIPQLRDHRSWVVTNRWGYGNRSLTWNIALLLREMPHNFKFLEIGVYMGATISLTSMLNKRYGKQGSIYGLTPLTSDGDKYSKHPEVNYEERIQQIYAHFGLSGDDLQIIHGFSNDESIIEIAKNEGPYHIILVDGCHDYDVVVSDIQRYGEMLVHGGYMIIDDASNDLKIPNGLIRMDWRGLPDVTKAVQDTLDKDSGFRFCYAVGHNKIYQKI